jgi:hypothetical protein
MTPPTPQQLATFNAALGWDFLALYGIHGQDAGELFEEELPIHWLVVFHPQMASILPRRAPARLPFLLRVIQAGGMALSHVLRVARETGYPLDLAAPVDLKGAIPGFHSLCLSAFQCPAPPSAITPMSWALALVPDNGPTEIMDRKGCRICWSEKDPEDRARSQESTRIGLNALSSVRVLLEAGVGVAPHEGRGVAGKSMHLWDLMDVHGVNWAAMSEDPMGVALGRVEEPWLGHRARCLLDKGYGIEGAAGWNGGKSPLLHELSWNPDFRGTELRVLVRLGASPKRLCGEHSGSKGVAKNCNAWHLSFGPFEWNNRKGSLEEWDMYQLALKFIWLTLHRVDPNVEDSRGDTIWHLVAAFPLPEVFGRILDRAGARCDRVNQEGKTPLDIARESGSVELECFLLGKKALRERDHFGTMLPRIAKDGLLPSGKRL